VAAPRGAALGCRHVVNLHIEVRAAGSCGDTRDETATAHRESRRKRAAQDFEPVVVAALLALELHRILLAYRPGRAREKRTGRGTRTRVVEAGGGSTPNHDCRRENGR